jgi:ketol-acid reductoisomerase
MTVIYHEDDGDLSVLSGKQVAVVGYGHLGRPFALNLRDSGVRVTVGVRDEERGEDASADGFPFATIEDAVTDAQIIMMMLPDEVMPQVYIERVSPHLERGDTLIFASGYNVAVGFIEAPPFVDVGLIAPRTIGAAVRERFLSGQGFHSLVASGQDASGHTWQTVLALAKAIGSLKTGAVEVSIEQEAELDLFMQQAIFPAFHHLMITAANLLIKIGYPPEAALTDLYLSGEFTDYLRQASEYGLLHALQLTSPTSRYGALSRMERFSDLKLERLMEITLEEIRRGSFAQEWAKEFTDGYPRLNKMFKMQTEMDLWELEQQALEMFGRGNVNES